MSFDWFTHHHSHGGSPVHRLPAGVKLGAALVMIVGTVVAPGINHGWPLGVALILLVAIVLSRLPLWFLFRRLLALSPFVLGTALANAVQPAGRTGWVDVALKSTLCLATITVVSNTTPLGEILRVLRRLRVPGLLITTIALMHRYLFVLADEAERMRRARLSRTFTRRRPHYWRALASLIAQLFTRASERAERIYDAMTARGWK
jgi:cobalt/nickel transport system permease protein